MSGTVNSVHTVLQLPTPVLVMSGGWSAVSPDGKVNTIDICKCINQGLLPYFGEGPDKRVVKRMPLVEMKQRHLFYPSRSHVDSICNEFHFKTLI